jgi:hypothetical protein
VAVGRKIEDEAEARRCLLSAKRGGVSPGEWARAHGIDGRSLHAWQMNLERRGTTGPTRPRKRKAKVQPRTVVELVPAAPIAQRGHEGRYVLEVGGARVEFGDDASAVTLRRVLEALRSC